MTECVAILTLKTCRAQRKLSAPHKYKAALTREPQPLDCEILTKKTPRPRHGKAKPGVQRIQDLETGMRIIYLT